MVEICEVLMFPFKPWKHKLDTGAETLRCLSSLRDFAPASDADRPSE